MSGEHRKLYESVCARFDHVADLMKLDTTANPTQ
jgi:hypothetical protein